ncbi:hypothetical protein QBC40DRAFT_275613 [Triangularia verruculosa]|uniref:WD repeat protein n=1 Tax=Triangularia verruculosa TaxID=2587418 RepID=A0AAN7AXV4_9PEZI|nr:hypothetical protein QBC40DRAFT_275613 [Triangularia verruculosa]
MYNQGKIMRKLLGKHAADSHESTASATVTSSPSNNYRPIAPQNVKYKTTAPLTCLDQSPDGKSAVLASHHVLKIIKLDGGLHVQEDVDLRAILTQQPTYRSNAPTAVADQLSIQDVKWGSVGNKEVLYTACTSGWIFEYNVQRARATRIGSHLDYIQMREDSRQVNSLDLNPHYTTWLLTGSQDGLLRCFDLRAPVSNRIWPTYRAITSFKSHADGVRHVQWSPKEGFIFACGTEQGMVLKWDMRKPTSPILRINAHEKACTSIAWHQDGDHLVSAGLDSKCNVWDMSRTDKRQKPKYVITTPAPVCSLAWRPGQWSATAQGKRASQLAMSYDESGVKRYGMNSVHIWDLARPTMPYKEIQRFDYAPNSILWHDQYLLWTAGRDGFNQCDVSFAPKVMDRQTMSAFAFSSQGEVAMCLDERPASTRPRPSMVHHDTTSAHGTPSYSSSPTTPRFSVSRSDSEDDAVGSFLGPRQQGNRKRRASMRSANTLSTTPPVGPAIGETLSLEDTIKVTGTYKPQQAMAMGTYLGPTNAEVDVYLSVNYFQAIHLELPYQPGGPSMPERIATILEHFAKAAARVRLSRLSHTWMNILFLVKLLLYRRAQYHLEFRMDKYQNSTVKKKDPIRNRSLGQLFSEPPKFGIDGEAAPRKMTSLASFDRALHPRSLLSEELESTSNQPTPVARPVPDTGAIRIDDSGRKKLTPIMEPESFTLPPAAHPRTLEPRPRLNSVPLSVTSHDSEATNASTEGYDFYDAEALSKAIDVPTRPKLTKVIEFREPGSPSRVRKPPVLRHDSDDSFTRIFSVSDEGREATSLVQPSDSSAPSQVMREAIVAAIRKGYPGGSGSGSEDGEYESRIRGKQIALGSLPGHQPARQLLQRTETDMTSYTAFTDEHHAITQTTTDSFESRFPSQTTDGGFGMDFPVGRTGVESPPLYQYELLSVEADLSPEDDLTPHIVETDYLYWRDDPSYPHPLCSSAGFGASETPIQPEKQIAATLAYEVRKTARDATAIVLLLKPLLSPDVLDSFQAAGILKQQHQRLMKLQAFTEAALMRKMCMKGWPGGVLSSWGEDYPNVTSSAQQGVQVGIFCSSCRKPREIDRSKASAESIWTCARCRAAMAPCAVCLQRDVPLTPKGQGDDAKEEEDEEPVLATWWICPGCGHGGHSTCMQSWHDGFEDECSSTDPEILVEFHSDGYCPMDGCGHACLPGKGRFETAAARTEEVSRAAAREATRNAIGMKASGESEGIAGGLQGHHHHHPSHQYRTTGSGRILDDQHHYAYYPSHGGSGSHSINIRSDEHNVPQSRAVESVREALANVGISSHSQGSSTRHSTPGASILSSSPGSRSAMMAAADRASGHGGADGRERRKSVKFVAQDDSKY